MGTCDAGHWQDPAWYSGGFKDVYDSAASSDGSGLTPLSYWDYVNALVSRYADSPALGMWEPMSEAEASTCPAAFEPSNCGGHQTCPDEAAAASALKYFFTTVGGQIHLLDPEHLVEAGFLGGGQCGTAGSDYESVGSSFGIDVLSVHDYYGAAPLGGDQWNGMAERFAQAKALDEPIITGEAGIEAGNGQAGCVTLQQRAQRHGGQDVRPIRSGRQCVFGVELVPPPWVRAATTLGRPTARSSTPSLATPRLTRDDRRRRSDRRWEERRQSAEEQVEACRPDRNKNEPLADPPEPSSDCP